MTTPHPAAARARRHGLGDIPRRSAAAFGDRTALVHRERRVSFAELEAMVDRTAAALHQEGLCKGETLVLLSRNCLEIPVLAFAAARIGVVLVPVNFTLTADEVAHLLTDCRAAAVVAEDALVPVAESALAGAQEAVRVRAAIPLGGGDPPPGWHSTHEWTGAARGPAPEVDVADDDVVRIMYTSGTESRPKGAMLTSRSLMWQYVSCILAGERSADDVDVHALPLYHCAQLDVFLLPDLYTGATSVILDGPEPAAVLRALEEERATSFFAPPTVWIALLRDPAFAGADLSALRKGYYGAGPLPAEVLREMTVRLPGVRLWNFYGQTEMCPLATVLGPGEQTVRPGSAGRPAPNVETRVVDEQDRPLPAGATGEIVHRGPHATLGYLGAPEKTADAFRNGWFHSGDLGYFDDDGYLWIVDRKKDMIKTGGENVASREVEEVLHALDGVAEAAVFGLPHPHWIEAVTAAVVPRPGAQLDEEQVRAHCRSRLAGYKVPKYVVFAGELPKNPSGKILKRGLREQHAHLTER